MSPEVGSIIILTLLIIVGGLLAARERVSEVEYELLQEHLENSWRRVTGTPTRDI